MSNSVFLLVRIAHVVTGTVWVGGAVLVTVFVAPAIRAAGPAGAYVTWMRAADSPSIWIQTGAGRVYSLGAISAFLAAAIGMGINIPAANRLGDLAASLRVEGEATTAAQSDLLRRLNVRLATGTRVAAILLILATAATVGVNR